MLFGMFKKEEPEMPAVPVKDLQGYLYDEYERVQRLQAEADKLKAENETLRKTVEEQRALSVLVEEGKRRLEVAQRNEAFEKERTDEAKASLQRERERNGELVAQVRKLETVLRDAKSGEDKASLQKEREKNGELVEQVGKLKTDLKDAKNGIDLAIQKVVPQIRENLLNGLIVHIDAMGPNTSKKQIMAYLQSIAEAENEK